MGRKPDSTIVHPTLRSLLQPGTNAQRQKYEKPELGPTKARSREPCLQSFSLDWPPHRFAHLHQPHCARPDHLRPASQLLEPLFLLQTCPVQQKGNHGENNLKRSFNLFFLKSCSVSSKPDRPTNSSETHSIIPSSSREESVAPREILPVIVRAQVSSQGHSNTPPNFSSNRAGEK